MVHPSEETFPAGFRRGNSSEEPIRLTAPAEDGEVRQQPKTENMMRNYSKLLGALAATTALAAGSAFAGSTAPMSTAAPASCDAAFQGDVHVGYNSDYIFRGTDLGDDMVEAGIDLSYKAYGLNFSGGLWYASIEDSALGNLAPFATIPDHYSELDVYGEVSKDFGFATLFAGYIWYHYENTSFQLGPFAGKLIDDSQEAYFGASRELVWGINGSLAYYWAIEGENQGYSELGLEKKFEFTPCINLDLGSKLGYLVEEGQLSHWTTSATLNFKVKDTFTISPYVAYSVELDGLEDYGSYNHSAISKFIGGPSSEENHFFGGVKASVSF